MHKAADQERPTTPEVKLNEVSSLGHLGGALFDIGWRLAATVIIFLWGGSQLDKRLETKPLFTVIGFLLVIVSFMLIVRQILQKIPRSMGGLRND